MEKLPSIKALLGAIIAIFSLQVLSSYVESYTKLEFQSDVSTLGSSLRHKTMLDVENNHEPVIKEEIQEEVLLEVLEIPLTIEVVPEIVYDGMTLDQLGEKLNRSLKSTLAGYGPVFAKKSLDNGVDPYIAVAIVLLETGCYSGKCSTLTSQCNNVGGMKGNPGCGGAYKRFATLDEGIHSYIANLSKNYYKKGLTTVELIGKKYAESKTWSTKVNNYIHILKTN